MGWLKLDALESSSYKISIKISFNFSIIILGQGAKYMLDTNPEGRIGEIEEIANLATYMCSDWASWVNAEVINDLH